MLITRLGSERRGGRDASNHEGRESNSKESNSKESHESASESAPGSEASAATGASTAAAGATDGAPDEELSIFDFLRTVNPEDMPVPRNKRGADGGSSPRGACRDARVACGGVLVLLTRSVSQMVQAVQLRPSHVVRQAVRAWPTRQSEVRKRVVCLFCMFVWVSECVAADLLSNSKRRGMSVSEAEEAASAVGAKVSVVVTFLQCSCGDDRLTDVAECGTEWCSGGWAARLAAARCGGGASEASAEERCQ